MREESPQIGRRTLKPCEQCGAEFYASPGHIAVGWGRYCSRACFGAAQTGAGNHRYRHDVPDRECQTCGKKFRIRPSHIANGDGKYCSRACAFSGKRRMYSCPVCEKRFSRAVSMVVVEKPCCSKKCVSAYKSRKESRTCLSCGKGFLMKRSDLSRGRGIGSFCSMKCKAKRMSGTSYTALGLPRHRGMGGFREDIGFYVRSRWEANWARYLGYLKSRGDIRDWEYEPRTFEFPVKRGSKFYTPDFRVVENDGTVIWHEVKGWMSPQSKTKLRRFRKYYPEEKLIIIAGPDIRGVFLRLGALIPEWETTTAKRGRF